MVYGFAEQSGGRVTIHSEVGKGTAVTMILPAVTIETEAVAATAPGRSAPRGRERVLVVEDEPHVLQFVSAQLISLGYDVTAVATGMDALQALARDTTFNLLFTDVVLPKGMSGVELARQAKAFRPDLKVLLTSGYSEDVFEQHGRLSSETLLLQKPYKRRELAETLRRALDGAGAEPALRATAADAKV
jgi:CheY-like chemotaxis protein